MIAYSLYGMLLWVVVVSIVFGTVSWIATLLIRPQIIDRKEVASKRVKAALDDASVAEQQLRVSKAQAESEVIDAKKNKLLDAIKEGDEDKQAALLRQLGR